MSVRVVPRLENGVMVCSMEGCTKPHSAHGLCNTHYRRWFRHGSPFVLKKAPPGQRAMCSVEGCPHRSNARGLCKTHYARLRNHGDIRADVPIKPLAPNGTGYVCRGYRVFTIRGHPLANRNGQVYEHRAVLYKMIGPGTHSCHWCGRKVIWKRGRGGDSLEADHLDGNGLNNIPENLVPSCAPCNRSRAGFGNPVDFEPREVT